METEIAKLETANEAAQVAIQNLSTKDRVLTVATEEGLTMNSVNVVTIAGGEQFEKETDIFKIRKKDLEVVNKKIKKVLKDDLKDCIEKDIIKNIKKLFSEVEDEAKLKKIVDDITKFVNGTYQRQLLENIDIKILVKDTTLINGVKEQSERYLFTLENSRLFNEKQETQSSFFCIICQ